MRLTAANSPSKVEGSILGKSLSATGSKNSMKGIRTKGRKGIKRRRSVVVRFNYTGQQAFGPTVVIDLPVAFHAW
jgi:hypothetical protein